MKKKVFIGACTLIIFMASTFMATLGLSHEFNFLNKVVVEEEKEQELKITEVALEINNQGNLAKKNQEVIDKAIDKEFDDYQFKIKESKEMQLAQEIQRSEEIQKQEEIKEVKRQDSTIRVATRGSVPTAKPAPKTEPKAEKPSNTETSSVGKWNDNDLYWLAKMIHAESRGEPYEGQVAVGAVILNRVTHKDFPNTVYDVIFARWASGYEFSPVADGSIHLEPNQSAIKAARDAANGWDPSGGAIYFYNPVKSTSKWIFSRPITKTIGEHVFAR